MNDFQTSLDDMFVAHSAGDWIASAASMAQPRELFGTLWHEGEACCLFADTNAGKSVLAVQIGNEIATVLEKKVLYFDFEMSHKQFQMRYADTVSGQQAYFSPLFIRVECKPGMLPEYMEHIMAGLHAEILRQKADIVIIDNLTWLCNSSENGEAAGDFMRLLLDMKRQLGLSVLVVSHTPKRETAMPIDQNSLAGSKRLANFFDSIFAIGIDRNEPAAGRYIKQIKVRSAPLLYHEGNVLRYDIVKDHDMLCFRHCPGQYTEHQFLAPVRPDRQNAAARRAERDSRILELHASGMSQRAIAEEMQVSVGTVNMAIKSGATAAAARTD